MTAAAASDSAVPVRGSAPIDSPLCRSLDVSLGCAAVARAGSIVASTSSDRSEPSVRCSPLLALAGPGAAAS